MEHHHQQRNGIEQPHDTVEAEAGAECLFHLVRLSASEPGREKTHVGGVETQVHELHIDVHRHGKADDAIFRLAEMTDQQGHGDEAIDSVDDVEYGGPVNSLYDASR